MTTPDRPLGKNDIEQAAFMRTVPDWFDRPIHEHESQELDELCNSVLLGCFNAAVQRIKNSPQPDAEELSAGTYRELIEPQCRGAVFRMRQKGHDTYNSGFSGVSRQGLMLGGPPKTITSLRVVHTLQSRGFEVYRIIDNSVSVIEFTPEQHDLAVMESRWNELEELLPDMGSPAAPHATDINDFYSKVGRLHPVLHELLPPYIS